MRRMGMRTLLATMAIAALLAFGMMAAGCQGNSGGDQAAPALRRQAPPSHRRDGCGGIADGAIRASVSFRPAGSGCPECRHVRLRRQVVLSFAEHYLRLVDEQSF